ncbi:hypothetical protein NLI96_g4505 [Meripilus lineatus]|uniref:Uncharacterized protein n=1 Tax=Meripilus lineatus TaxID=2056292 RepID=A0AAD5YK17_9APHY|nr:hypothetical protein NLI96_g4505 [Physisporinus lineatus]
MHFSTYTTIILALAASLPAFCAPTSFSHASTISARDDEVDLITRNVLETLLARSLTVRKFEQPPSSTQPPAPPNSPVETAFPTNQRHRQGQRHQFRRPQRRPREDIVDVLAREYGDRMMRRDDFQWWE